MPSRRGSKSGQRPTTPKRKARKPLLARRAFVERLDARVLLAADLLCDFGDAPDASVAAIYQYPTTLADDGARHAVATTTPLALGSSVTSEADGTPSAAADGDTGDDGVVLGGILTSGFATPVTVQASGSGQLHGWVDFNRDGDWNDAGEKVFAGVAVTAGSTPLTITTPEGASLGTTFARFRLSSDGSASAPTGLAADGEVEDYSFTIRSNDPPTVARSIADRAVREDAPQQAIDLTQVFDDVDLRNGNGDRLTYEIVSNSNPELVTATIDAGTLKLSFAPQQHGQATLTVAAQDQAGRSISNSFTITVEEVNDVPQLANDQFVTPEDQPLQLTAAELLLNDRPGPANESGQQLTVTGVSSTSGNGGTVTLASDGSITYEPAENFQGSDFFSYVVADNGTTAGAADPKVSTAIVRVQVRDENDAPTAAADNVTVLEDGSIILTGLLANDSPGPGEQGQQTIKIVHVSAPSQRGGSVELRADGSVVYTPPENYNGEDSFTYTIEDNGTTNGQADPKRATATVTITVAEVNDSPVAGADTAITAEDTELVLQSSALLANDKTGPTNEAGQQLTVTFATSSRKGGLVVHDADGTVRYTPPANFHGSDSFTYSIQDNGTSSGVPDPKSAAGEVTVTVTSVNDAPVAEDVRFQASEDGFLLAVAFVASDVDTEGGPEELTYTLLSQPSQGSASDLGNGVFTFDPGDDFHDLAPGEIREVTFTYKATDSLGLDSSPATVTVEVFGVNDAPQAAESAVSGRQGIELVGTFNAEDVDGDDTAATLVYEIISPPGRGAVTVLSGNTYRYDPGSDLDYLAESQTEDVTFTYRAVDRHGATTDETRVTVTIVGINDAPTVSLVGMQAREDGPAVTGSFAGDDVDQDDDRTTLTYVVEAPPTEGSVTNNSDGTFTFNPGTAFQDLGAGASRTVTLQYTAVDTKGVRSAAGEIQITVSGENDAPVARDDSYELAAGESSLEVLAPGVLDNDTDVDSTHLTAVLVAGPSAGTVQLDANGSFIYTRGANFTDSDSFTYKLNDGQADSGTATVVIGVLDPVSPPVAVDDQAQTVANTPVKINVLSNDSDEDGSLEPATVRIINAPANGVATVNSDGTIDYAPGPDFEGTDQFSYTVDDDDGLTSNEALVSIEVLPLVVQRCPWQNPQDALDINADGSVSPLDALVIINELNFVGSHALPNPPLPPQAPPPFYDANCDGSVSPADALAVINFLNSRPAPGGGGNAEGEAPRQGTPRQHQHLHVTGSLPEDSAAVQSVSLAPTADRPTMLLAPPSEVADQWPSRGLQNSASRLTASIASADDDRQETLIADPLAEGDTASAALRTALAEVAAEHDEQPLDELLDEIAQDVHCAHAFTDHA